MYDRTDSVFADSVYRQIKGSTIKLKDDTQFCVDIPFNPQIRFERTTIGWRKSVKGAGSESSYSKSNFPAKQAQYIEEELYWTLHREGKKICLDLQQQYEPRLKSVLFCENGTFWIIVLVLLCIFGGIGVLVYGRGNDINLDFVAGILIVGGCLSVLLLFCLKKVQQNKKDKLLNEIMIEFESRLNKLDVMEANGNEWATKLILAIKVKVNENKNQSMEFKMSLYRSLNAGTITIMS